MLKPSETAPEQRKRPLVMMFDRMSVLPCEIPKNSIGMRTARLVAKSKGGTTSIDIQTISLKRPPDNRKACGDCVNFVSAVGKVQR